MKFYIVDAFTDVLFGGNPAGVVWVEKEEEFPATEIMRKTAAELRYSETAFIKQIGDYSFHTRYFTPEAEVELCGHATIGAFYALAQAEIISKNGQYCNQTLAGNLSVSLEDGIVLMDMSTPRHIDTIQDPEALYELYCIMGIPDAALNATLAPESEKKWLPEIISTGLPDIMMPVPDENILVAIQPNFLVLSELSKRYQVVGVHAFTVNNKDGNIHCRNFAPLYGIDEEAATGTANGALTYYLYKNGFIANGTETIFLQGEAMQRASKIRSKIIDKNGIIQIQIGGNGMILASGTIFI